MYDWEPELRKRLHAGARPITIAFLIDELEGGNDYQTTIWSGVLATAKDFGINICTLQGGPLNNAEVRPSAEKYTGDVLSTLNSIYRLDKERLSGLIIMGSLGTYVSPEEYRAFHASYAPLPTVSIGTKGDGITSVTVANYSGVYQSVKHLVERHRLSRIAYIRGPREVPEACDRYRAYEDALRDSGIAPDPRLVYEGHFLHEHGVEAIRELLDRRKVEFDAVIAGNDNMTIGAINELRSRNIRVPYDVAAVGFDDTEEADYFIPGITTVRQPIRQLGTDSVMLLLARICGVSCPRDLVLDTELVVRQSCGCKHMFENKRSAAIRTCSAADDTEILSNVKIEELAAEVVQLLNIKSSHESAFVQSVSEDIDRLFFKTLVSGERDRFFSLIEDAFYRVSNKRINPSYWDVLLNQLKTVCAPNLIGPYNAAVAGDFFAEWGFVISKLRNKLELYMSVVSRNEVIRISNMSYNLIAHYEIKKILRTLEKSLPDFGIKKVFLSLFESYGKEGDVRKRDRTESRFLFGLNETGMVDLERNAPFLSDRILSTPLLQGESNLLVMPLFVIMDFIGFIVFEPNPALSYSYSMVQRYVSSAIYGAVIVRERVFTEQKLKVTLKELEAMNLQLKNLSIKDELTGTYNRRGFFQMAQTYHGHALQNGRSYLLFFIDLDGLKQINDRYGHEAGDFVIHGAGAILKETFRRTDIVARLGGDEFVVIAMDTDAAQTNLILEHLQNNIDGFNVASNKPYKLSLSSGVVEADWRCSKCIEDLLKEADEKLYVIKQRRKEWATREAQQGAVPAERSESTE
jgi:diguanylate cyclase (GGDEF)-like protein